nr:hypothetical protein [uncultured Psychroserpens sp.]
MKNQLTTLTLILIAFLIIACDRNEKLLIVDSIRIGEYNRLMSLPLDEFDQSSQGFRKHSGDYELVRMLIPEYIKVNKLTSTQSRNLRWHLGQLHAFRENYKAAIAEWEQAYEGGSKTWECYVTGSIAFLEKDKPKLREAIQVLKRQDNQMNLSILERFLKHFNASYTKAYNNL